VDTALVARLQASRLSSLRLWRLVRRLPSPFPMAGSAVSSTRTAAVAPKARTVPCSNSTWTPDRCTPPRRTTSPTSRASLSRSPSVLTAATLSPARRLAARARTPTLWATCLAAVTISPSRLAEQATSVSVSSSALKPFARQLCRTNSSFDWNLSSSIYTHPPTDIAYPISNPLQWFSSLLLTVIVRFTPLLYRLPSPWFM